MESKRLNLAVLGRAASDIDRLIAAGVAFFLLALPFHLVIKGLLPGPVGTYWKEGLLACLLLLWLASGALRRQLRLADTPLDVAVLIYLGLLVVRFLLDRSGLVGAWGLYISVLYLPLFWLVPAALRRYPGSLTALLAMLVGVCGVVALGGLLEFALNRALWPSAELVARQGFPDVYVYGTNLRRVYFVFDSPTALANTLSLVLPLALVLTLLVRRTWQRALAAAAAVLMAACIIVTFSRGIWVATLFGLALMAVVSATAVGGRRVLALAAAAAGVIALTWLALTLLSPAQASLNNPNVVELSPAAFAAAPAGAEGEKLLDQAPAAGSADIRMWTLTDAIAGGTDTRRVLYSHPAANAPGRIVYRVQVPAASALRFAIALDPAVWSTELGDGVRFEVRVASPTGAQTVAFDRYTNPKMNPSDRRWRNFILDLAPWAGQTVDLNLLTLPGPAGDWGYDWAGWADVEVVSLPAGYFPPTQRQNVLLDHLRSIGNWSGDETNRDRLQAWSATLSAWRANPLWGSGLGTTGTAALRTNPATAVVTESQVLKALGELGIPGLLALAYLWIMVGLTGWRTYRRTLAPSRRILLLGVLSGLTIVFVEGFVYQNLEVKQVSAYTWTLAGVLTYLAGKQGT